MSHDKFNGMPGGRPSPLNYLARKKADKQRSAERTEALAAENSHLKLLLQEVVPLVIARKYMLTFRGDPLAAEMDDWLERAKALGIDLSNPSPSAPAKKEGGT